MLGAICGDIIGSTHEFEPVKTTDFELLTARNHWTDDTVCTMAVADALMSSSAVGERLAQWVGLYPDAGYGLDFYLWALKSPAERRPYGSWGNGSAMRASPAGWLAHSLREACELARISAEPTHDSHHGMRGAKAVAVGVRMALEQWSAEEIRNVLQDKFGYDLSQPPDEIRLSYRFEVACQKSVPQALCCLFSAHSFEEAVRLAVSLGGDADTQADIAGALAEPLFGLPEAISGACIDLLPRPMQDVLLQFRSQTSGRSYFKTDPAAIQRDRAPIRDGDDPFCDEKTAREVQKAEALMARIQAQKERSSKPSLWRRLFIVPSE
jgi:ADP-ribosyl-[dinitrogen reductase] hydrolase